MVVSQTLKVVSVYRYDLSFTHLPGSLYVISTYNIYLLLVTT